MKLRLAEPCMRAPVKMWGPAVLEAPAAEDVAVAREAWDGLVRLAH